MWRGRLALKSPEPMPLLTAKQVAARLQLKSERTVAKLGIHPVRVGCGRGVIRYRPEDIEAYIQNRVEQPAERKAHVNRVSKRPQEMGIPGLPSREQIRQIRLGYQNGG